MDFVEVFSPIVRMEAVRIFLTVVMQIRWSVIQLDVKSVFLNRELQEEVYVNQPEGFVKLGYEDMVCGPK